MCLHKITKTNPADSGIGYKVVIEKRGRFYSLIKGARKSYPSGKWLKEKDYRIKKYANDIIGFKGIEYKAGFHILRRKKDALELISNLGSPPSKTKFATVKVKYRRAVVLGRYPVGYIWKSQKLKALTATATTSNWTSWTISSTSSATTSMNCNCTFGKVFKIVPVIVAKEMMIL